ncbi:MAG: GNAT family N-acetyltransferase [Anaerolineae bacterium]|nr:GNAT family N-acetyltransferase [Anaerolineae bacterium]
MEDKGVSLDGPRVLIRSLQRQDLDIMETWPPSQDPLYRLFDWPICSPEQNDAWFSRLVRDKNRVYYAVENEKGDLIGRLSLREIYAHRSARLGIGFGPPFVGQGYGTEALQIFLRYYFLTLKFRQMVLDVAAVNTRAIRCYLRCGFEKIDANYRGLGSDEDVSFLDTAKYKHLARFFKIAGYSKRMLFYDMVLERRKWLQHSGTGMSHPQK